LPEDNIRLPSRKLVFDKLEEKLVAMQLEKLLPDVITFAGNGEPTLHPEFSGIIDDTIKLRNHYAPDARIAVLSNATMLHKPAVFNSLLKVDDNIQKLDSAFVETIRLLDQPRKSFNLRKTVEQLKSFDGRVIIQTMFVRGVWKGEVIDNTTDKEVLAWLKLIEEISPRKVMIYTISRDTPIESLEKIPSHELEKIGEMVRIAGFDVQVSG
jgi:wyosine [tRNA(Phe)-imidazoG37] synthetase (radical SAM superfamily)